MAATQLHAFIRHLRSVLRAKSDGGLPDAELLERYRTLRDEAAFEVLLWRHGPMVLRVCQQLLGNEQDIEDAFQATFLALARKAGSLIRREAISSWLYKVAYPVAVDARRLSARLAVREKAVATLPVVESSEDLALEVAQRELYSRLDAEIQRLPRKYRDPVVLCHLEGKTQEEAARELGWAKGTVSTRLIHAREMLRRRLQRHGDTFPALLPALASRPLPANLAQLTLRAVLSVQTPSAAGRLISAKALALSEGVLKALALSQWKITAALLLLLVSLGTGVGWLTYQGIYASPGHSDAPVSPQVEVNDRGIPSALGKLDPSRIPPEDRFAWQPPELVSVLGEHRGRSWGGHLDGVAFSPDGKLIASCGWDDLAVRLWDTSTLRERAVLRQHTKKVYSVAFSPDGKSLASGGDDKTLVLWDLTATPPKACVVLDLATEPAYTIAFSPDGSILVAGASKGIRLWKVVANRQPEPLSPLPNGPIGSLAFSRDGRTLASGTSQDGSIVLWDMPQGTRKTILRSQFLHDVRSVAMSPDGKTLACTGDAVRPSLARNRSDPRSVALEDHGYPVVVWDLTDPAHPRERPIPSKPTWQVFTVKFSPDGKTLATGNHDGTLRLWSLASAEPKERATVPTPSWISSLDISPDGKNLVLGQGSGMVTLWDLTTPVPTERFGHRGHRATVHTVELARSGVLVSGGSDSTLRLWDLTGVQAKERFSLKGYVSVYGLALSQDGKTLAFDNGQGAMEVWDIGKDKPRNRLQWSAKTKENQNGSYALQMSPDGKILVSSTKCAGHYRLFTHSFPRPSRPSPPPPMIKQRRPAAAAALDKRPHHLPGWP